MSVDICFTSRNIFMKKEVLGPIERFNTLYIHVYGQGNNQVSNPGLSFKQFLLYVWLLTNPLISHERHTNKHYSHRKTIQHMYK